MSKKIVRIVVGYDYSDLAGLALKKSFELASHYDKAEVHVVHVVMLGLQSAGGVAGLPVHPTISLDSSYENLKERVTREYEQWKKQTGRSFEALKLHVRSDAPTFEIAQLAADLEAELVVIGTHGRRGFKRFVLGSVAEGVVRMAHCAVLVVRPAGDDADDTPQIKPPCPQCLAERKRTQGAELWCDEHRALHGQRHTYPELYS